MNIKELFNEHKRTGQGFTILLILSILLFGIEFYPILSAPFTFNTEFVLLLIYLIIVTIIKLAVPLVLERKRISFAAHLTLIAFFLPNYLRDIFSLSNQMDLFSFTTLLLGVLMSVYALLKLYAHSNEIKTYISKPNPGLSIILLISLIKVYLDYSFQTMVVYLLLFFIIIITTNAIEILPLSISIYSVSLASNLYRLFMNTQAPTGVYLNIMFSIIINLVMLVYIIKIYRDYHSYNDNNYTS